MRNEKEIIDKLEESYRRKKKALNIADREYMDIVYNVLDWVLESGDDPFYDYPLEEE